MGAFFGGQFDTSGYTITAAAIPPGLYDIVVYAHSRVTAAFSGARVVTVTVF